MWRFVLVSAILWVSSLGYAGQALAQSAPGALVIQDGMAAGAPAAVFPTTRPAGGNSRGTRTAARDLRAEGANSERDRPAPRSSR